MVVFKTAALGRGHLVRPKKINTVSRERDREREKTHTHIHTHTQARHPPSPCPTCDISDSDQVIVVDASETAIRYFESYRQDITSIASVRARHPKKNQDRAPLVSPNIARPPPPPPPPSAPAPAPAPSQDGCHGVHGRADGGGPKLWVKKVVYVSPIVVSLSLALSLSPPPSLLFGCRCRLATRSITEAASWRWRWKRRLWEMCVCVCLGGGVVWDGLHTSRPPPPTRAGTSWFCLLI